MKTLLPILVLICAGACSAQQPCVGGEHPHNAPDCIPAEKLIQVPAPQVAPLKCGKYEHEEPDYAALEHCPKGTWCTTVPRCAPDMHTVTEREWQELMDRLKKLENPPCPSILDKSPKQCPL